MENLKELNELVKSLDVAKQRLELFDNGNHIMYLTINSYQNSTNDVELSEDDSTAVTSLMIELYSKKVNSLSKELSKFKIKKSAKI